MKCLRSIELMGRLLQGVLGLIVENNRGRGDAPGGTGLKGERAWRRLTAGMGEDEEEWSRVSPARLLAARNLRTEVRSCTAW